MTSKPVALLLADLGRGQDPLAGPTSPTTTRSPRPSSRRSSTGPSFPDRFGSVEHAAPSATLLPLVQQRAPPQRPGLPDAGRRALRPRRWRPRGAAPASSLAAYAAHPERFVNGPPQPASARRPSGSTRPEKTTHQDAPGSTQTDPDDLRVVPVCRTYEPQGRFLAYLGPRRTATLICASLVSQSH